MLKQAKKGLFLATALFIYLNGQAQETTGIKFEEGKSWEELKVKAKQEHKYIFLDAYATWCGPCKKMDREVYVNEGLGTYMNANFISAKVQIDSSAKDNEEIKSNYAFAKKISTDYKIAVVPSFLFFDSEGNLIHRNEGYYQLEGFKQVCEIAADPSKNDKAIRDNFYRGKLRGSELLEFGKRLKHFKNDALALEVAKKYRVTVLDQKEPKEALNKDILEVFKYFPEVYSRRDALIRYIFQHQKEADQLMASPGYSKGLVDYYVRKEMIFPKIQDENGKPIFKTPYWNNIEKEIAKEWDEKIAKRTIIKGKIWYYAKKKDYSNWVKYELEQVELNGVPSKEDVWGVAGLNDMVFSVIFKYSTDPYALKKASEYMAILIKYDPTSHANMDTYANVLYKSGQKEKALELERKALKLAELENSKEDVNIYTEVIKKMEKNIPTWN